MLCSLRPVVSAPSLPQRRLLGREARLQATAAGSCPGLVRPAGREATATGEEVCHRFRRTGLPGRGPVGTRGRGGLDGGRGAREAWTGAFMCLPGRNSEGEEAGEQARRPACRRQTPGCWPTCLAAGPGWLGTGLACRAGLPGGVGWVGEHLWEALPAGCPLPLGGSSLRRADGSRLQVPRQSTEATGTRTGNGGS